MSYFWSSIGKKQVMGITGLVWYLFLFVHLLGNTGLFAGPEVFNAYSHFLLTKLWMVVYPVELFFLAGLTIHVVLAILVSLENRAARPDAYVRFTSAAAGKGKTEGSSAASRSMVYGGVGLGLFITLHVLVFKFGVGTVPATQMVDGIPVRDIYSLVLSSFSNPYSLAASCAAFLVLAAHLWHGVQSSVQSAGLYHPKYVPFVRFFSKTYAVIIGGGFSAIALWAYFQGGV